MLTNQIKKNTQKAKEEKTEEKKIKYRKFKPTFFATLNSLYRQVEQQIEMPAS